MIIARHASLLLSPAATIGAPISLCVTGRADGTAGPGRKAPAATGPEPDTNPGRIADAAHAR